MKTQTMYMLEVNMQVESIKCNFADTLQWEYTGDRGDFPHNGPLVRNVCVFFRSVDVLLGNSVKASMAI